MFVSEKRKRKKLARLLGVQASKCEDLLEENQNLSHQRAALLKLLLEKDRQLEDLHASPSPSPSPVKAPASQPPHQVPGSALQRAVGVKLRHLAKVFTIWRLQSERRAIAEALDSQQQRMLAVVKHDFAGRSLQALTRSVARAADRSKGAAFRELARFWTAVRGLEQQRLTAVIALMGVIEKARQRALLRGLEAVGAVDAVGREVERAREDQVERMERLKQDSMQFMAFNTAYHVLRAKRKHLLRLALHRWPRAPDPRLAVADHALREQQSALTRLRVAAEDAERERRAAEQRAAQASASLQMEAERRAELQRLWEEQRRDSEQQRGGMQGEIDRQRLEIGRLENELLELREDLEDSRPAGQVEAQRRELAHLNEQLLRSRNLETALREDNTLLKRLAQEEADQRGALGRALEGAALEKKALLGKMEQAVADLQLMSQNYQAQLAENSELRERVAAP